jgi:hypothetical protein
VAALADGGFVVAWWTFNGNGHGIFAQRFNAAGERAGPVIAVDDDYESGTIKDKVSVAGLKDGRFVVTWHSYYLDRPIFSYFAIWTRLYTATGEPVEDFVYDNDNGLWLVPRPSIAALTTGGFVEAWQNYPLRSPARGNDFGQRFTADGTLSGDEFRANTFTRENQDEPAVAGLTAGRFVIVWQSVPQDGSGIGVYAQRYTANGTRAGREFRVNSTTNLSQFDPAVAGLNDGGFIVTWTSQQDGSESGIYGQRYSAGGAKVGSEFRVNNVIAGLQENPAIASLEDGGFVITWTSPDEADTGIFGRRYTAAGTPVRRQFRVNRTERRTQTLSSVAALKDGGFVVVWESDQRSGTPAIYGQRFGP